MSKLLVLCALLLCIRVQAEDQVDLQWTICDSSDLISQHLDPQATILRSGSVSYFDTVPPQYAQIGVSFRVKDAKDEAESSVKLRFSRPVQITNSACEWDHYGQTETYTCEMLNQDLDSSLWSDDQVRYVSSLNVDWSRLRTFGPYPSKKWKVQVHGYTMVLDTVSPPAPLPVLMEASVKVPYSDKDQAYKILTKELLSQGVKLCDVQESKTLRLFHAMGLLPASN